MWKFVYVNDLACKWTGYSREELLQKTPMDIDSGKTCEQIKANARQLLAQGSLIFETKLLAKDGRQIPVEMSLRLFEWDGRQMTASIAHDLTGRHRMAEAARELEARYRQLFEVESDAVLMVDLETEHFIDSNPAAQKLYGYSNREFLLLKPWDVSAEPEKSHAAIAEYQRYVPLRWHRKKDGTVFPVEIAGSYFDSQGRKLYVAALRDITQRKRLEERLRQAQKMEAIGQLAGGVAHDFNNILSATLMQLGLLQHQPDLSAEARESLKEMETEAMQGVSLIRQLLLFSRRHLVLTAPVDMNELISNLLTMLRRLLGEHVHITFQNSSDSVWVNADAGMVEQVVLNLCINARDAMPKGGTLTLNITPVQLSVEQAVSCPNRRPGNYVCLCVTDTGCGIDEAVLGRIFEPFFTTKESGKGTGLGLATVYGIAEQHGGWVEVESAVGQGSSFRVYIPAGAKPCDAPAIPRPSDTVRGGSETILLVEDQLSVRRPTALWLRKLGYAVLEAGDGKEALKVWEQHRDRIGLLFTDMVMPGGMTGVDLAKRLKEEKSCLKVIITSGYIAPLARPDSAAVQDFTFLVKPYSAAALAKTTRDCLDAT